MRIALRAVVVVAIFAVGIYVGKLIFRQGSTVPAPAPTYFNQSAAQGDSVGVGAGTITGLVLISHTVSLPSLTAKSMRP